ncbi:hypothetical protein F7734_16250 [Scytonema sp. UIC 10036]|uniref:hypothetical protein n=1 Tax=Scytonema sp. UIC 10036 TaxID=2304196 RepID=UPI0012DACDF5|nr:hypothetical protein [Scytonema sp. UIC 10036]MUG93876.1 hypothetical protein [Scytonema sp. UIC 10036]
MPNVHDVGHSPTYWSPIANNLYLRLQVDLTEINFFDKRFVKALKVSLVDEQI